MESFALTFKKELLHIIKHCTAQTRSQLTPVDFTACDLNLAQYHSFLQANQLRVENIADIYNLSPLQEGMLFHKLMDTDAPAYFNQVELTIATAIDIPYFKKCWEQILQAHPVLRTSFHTEGLPRPLQVVHKQTSLHFVSTDLRTHAVEEQEQIIQDYILSDRAKGFDLSKPSLLRLALFQTDAALSLIHI